MSLRSRNCPQETFSLYLQVFMTLGAPRSAAGRAEGAVSLRTCSEHLLAPRAVRRVRVSQVSWAGTAVKEGATGETEKCAQTVSALRSYSSAEELEFSPLASFYLALL